LDTATADVMVRLVLGVARLGEADLAGWWSSHGLDRAGSYVLSRAFRRTWRPAALELDVLCAGRRHDDALASRRTALHLFSDELPFRRWAVAWLAEQKTAVKPDPIFDTLAGWDLPTARAALADWAGGDSSHEVVGEGMRLGELTRSGLEKDALLASTGRRLAATYVSLDGVFRAPYFDLVG
jgi:hypothetical protein